MDNTVTAYIECTYLHFERQKQQQQQHFKVCSNNPKMEFGKVNTKKHTHLKRTNRLNLCEFELKNVYV